MMGMTSRVNLAPPVTATSTTFIASSIAIMEMNDMPIAVLNANLKAICLDKISVSRAIEVSNPLKMASDMMAQTGQPMPLTWKYRMVPISPMEQPIRHHSVL